MIELEFGATKKGQGAIEGLKDLDNEGGVAHQLHILFACCSKPGLLYHTAAYILIVISSKPSHSSHFAASQTLQESLYSMPR